MEQETKISLLELDETGELAELVSDVIDRLESVPTFASISDFSLRANIRSNIAALLTPLPKVPVDRAFAPMFRSAYVRAASRKQSLTKSLGIHIVVAAALLYLPSLPNPVATSDSIRINEYKVLYFSKSDLLPPISTPKKDRKSPTAQRTKPSIPTTPSNERSLNAPPLQELVSHPEKPDNTRQTIVQPDAPNLRIEAHVDIPNMIVWRDNVVPPRPDADESKQSLARVRVPRLPTPVVQAPIPEPPKLDVAKQDLSAIHMTAVPLARVPKLPVPRTPDPEVPKLEEQPPPDINPVALKNLVAIGITPAPPKENVKVPEGNRSGEFAASMDASRERAPKVISMPDVPNSDFSQELAKIRVPDLTIPGNGRALPPAPAPVVMTPPEPTRSASPVTRQPNLRDLMAKATQPPSLPTMTRGIQTDPFFGPRRVFTTSINMPNLTSGSGSWVLRFAELNADGGAGNEEISSPEAIRKVDPQYVPSAVRDRVEGTVTLVAHILRDGSVKDVKVLSSVDPRLDASAAAAFVNWEFRPARKHGQPVDLEVIVQIPFRLPQS